MTPPNIPLVYRLWHLYIEPVLALSGAYFLWFTPETYHDYMPPSTAYSAQAQIIYNQLAATYLLFAFNQAVVLRAARDLRVWKLLLMGMALCDAGHLYSMWAAMGTQALLEPWVWRADDWATIVSTVWPFVLRVAFLLGVGLGVS